MKMHNQFRSSLLIRIALLRNSRTYLLTWPNAPFQDLSNWELPEYILGQTLLMILQIQWATLVTYHFFRAHIFWQKCWNRTFSVIIFLLTFYLFGDIEKKNRNHSCGSSCYANDNLTKLHVQPKRLYFLIAFCARHYPWWSLWQKNTKNNYFNQVKSLFSVVEFSNIVTFWRNARFDVN